MFDGLETINYYQRLTETTWGTAISISGLKRQDSKLIKKFTDDGEYTGVIVIWEVFSNQLVIQPCEGDKLIASDSQSYIVKQIDRCDFNSRYRLFTQAINHQFI